MSSPSSSVNLESRCIGCLLGHLCGDILGAAVEGFSDRDISNEYGTITDFIKGKHMGLRSAKDPERINMYTDDSNSMLALASSIVENSGLNPLHTAKTYSLFWSTGIKRGYPYSAERVLQAVLDNPSSYSKCGTISFPDGSFANGGAMRIAPLALAFRHCNDTQLYNAVKLAIISSHSHPEAIDAAFLLCKTIIYALNCSTVQDFQPMNLLQLLIESSTNEVMKEQLNKLKGLWKQHKNPTSGTMFVLDRIVVKTMGNTFQLRAIEAFPCVLWCVLDKFQEPEQAVIKAVMLGGDTDTIACMVGDIMGTLHGIDWIPKRWYDNIESNSTDNCGRGRDFAIELAKQLANLDCKDILPDSELSHKPQSTQSINDNGNTIVNTNNSERKEIGADK